MRKHLLSALLLAFACVATANAVPALPVKHQLTQPDGTTLTVYLRGDEFIHYHETVDGILVQKSPDGFYHYAELSQQGRVIASPLIARDQDFRSSGEVAYIKNIKQENLREVLVKEQIIEKSQRLKAGTEPGEIQKTFPTSGEVKGVVILAQYQDIKFSKSVTTEAYDRVMNEENYDGPLASGSVRDYYLDQSHNQLKLNFDVFGPITLPQNRAYYGTNEKTGVIKMVSEAARLVKEANPEHDFSKYDLDHDTYIDFVYIIYAGCAESQGAASESVWPMSGSMKGLDFVYYNGLVLGTYAVSSELRGKEEGTDNLDGIGTFCHEFGHVLGLMDIYDTRQGDCVGMGYWDVMDVGSYNDRSKTPAGFTAFDKYSLGWLTPELLTDPGTVTLEALSTSNKAYFLVSETDPNEYFTFENRQKIGWDAALPGHGLLVSHINYDKQIWKINSVNTNGIDHVYLVIADKTKKRERREHDMRDVFPGSANVTSFTSDTHPDMKWKSGAKVDKSITNIREENGVILFELTNATGIESVESNAEINAYSNGQSIIIPNENQERVAIYSIAGQLIYTNDKADCHTQVNKGCYIIRVGNKTSKVNVK